MKKIYFLLVALLTATTMQAQMEFVELLDKNGDAVNNPYYFTNYDGKVYFQASGPYGSELYVSDGTQAGTEVIDVNPGTYEGTKWEQDADGNYIQVPATFQNASNPSGFFEFNGELYFSVFIDSEKQYKYNAGTATYSVVDETTAFNSPIVDGDKVYYGNGNDELCVFDGSTSSIVPSTGQTHMFFGGTLYNDMIIFYGDVDGSEATTGYELCKYNITAQTFEFVKNIDNNTYGPGWARDAYIKNFTVLNNKVYFSGDYNDSWMWETDGTEANTVQVADATNLSGTDSYYVKNDKLYFEGSSDAGSDLYVFDPATPSVTNISLQGDAITPVDHMPESFCEYLDETYYKGYGPGYAVSLYSTGGTDISAISTSFLGIYGLGSYESETASNLLVNGITDADADNSSLFIHVTPTAIGDEVSTTSITIAPNPSYGMVNVTGLESPSATYEIYDLTGKRVEGGAINSNQINYNVGAGIYILKVVDAANTKVMKIVVK